MRRALYFSIIGLVAAGFYFARAQGTAANVQIDSDDIGGIAATSKGPEAGIWVIAETTGLPTKFSRTVVTDERGRFVIPDLPKATYTVWARGYGLVDSPKVQTAPGKMLNLAPTVAPNAAAAAAMYPASYWYSLMKVPEKNEFPGTGPSGNGINPNIHSQGEWIHMIKTDSCESCHQLGNKATREIPAFFGTFDSPAKAWQRRVQSGQAGNAMVGGLNSLGMQRASEMFGDWTSRIAKGELPPAPPRPAGVDRPSPIA